MMLRVMSQMMLCLSAQMKRSKSYDLDFLSLEDEKTVKPVISPSAKPNRILCAGRAEPGLIREWLFLLERVDKKDA